jgi:hypothetical protein
MDEINPAWPRPASRYREDLARRVCEGAAQGKSLAEIARMPAMPQAQTVRRWLAAEPVFAARYAVARERGGPLKRGRPSTYHEAIGRAICERLLEGRAITHICADADMPPVATVFWWLKTHPEFAEMYRVAREIQAHIKFDEVWEEAKAATPGTAFVARVRIQALQWQAAKLAPRAYGPKPLDEAEAAPRLTVVIRRFGDEEGEARFDPLT